MNSTNYSFSFSWCNVCDRYSYKFPYNIREWSGRGGFPSGAHCGSLPDWLVSHRSRGGHSIRSAAGWKRHWRGNWLKHLITCHMSTYQIYNNQNCPQLEGITDNVTMLNLIAIFRHIQTLRGSTNYMFFSWLTILNVLCECLCKWSVSYYY